MNLKATTQRSYYGKATVRKENNLLILKSYNTDVAAYDCEEKVFIRLWAGWSKTSSNHINDFLRMLGLPTLTKSEWLSIPCANPEAVYKIYVSNGFYMHSGTALLTEEEAEREIARLTENNGFRIAWYE